MVIQIQDLLKSISEKYTNCSYYRSKGVITDVNVDSSTREIFEIEYTKPDTLILKTYSPGVTDEDDMTVITIRDGKVNTNFSRSRLNQAEKLKPEFDKRGGWQKWLVTKVNSLNKQSLNERTKTRALDEVTIFDTGYISGMVYYHWFPKLRRPWTKERCTLLSDKHVGGVDCYQIRFIEEPTLIWVSKEDLLIRKVEIESTGCFSYWHKTFLQNYANFTLASYGHKLKDTAPEFAEMLKKTSNNYPEDHKIGEFEEIEIR